MNDIPQPPPDPPLDLLKEQIWEEDLGPLLERIDHLEAALEKTAPEPPAQPDPQVVDGLAKLEARLGELDRRVAAVQAAPKTPAQPDPQLAEELAKLEARLGEVDRRVAAAQAAGATGAGTLEKTMRELAELRPAVQAATIRYSEIGDLKKNALVLQNQVESLSQALECQKKDPLNGSSAKLNELQTEVLALRAEVRQSFKQLAALESPADAHGADLRAMADEIAALKKSVVEYAPALAERNSRITSLEAELAERNNRITGLEAESAGMAARLAALHQRVGALETPADALRPPIEDDVHSIRDNLDQIRSFMNTLARKL